jgi:XTP/dITP diphosphohydrolase
MRVVLATTNEHKVHELRQILRDVVEELELEIVSAAQVAGLPEVAETEVTFVGNATLKALAVARASGLPALADDSGLTVDVLGGAPGVFSARWSGSHAGAGAPRAVKDRANLELLLEQVADVPDEHRGAAFVCAAVVATPDGRTASATGEVRGALARAPRGTNGFGYDPVFVPADQTAGEQRHLAEYGDTEKNAISHRGRAFRALEPAIRGLLTPSGPTT